MKIVIVHLSDIHFRSAEDSVFHRPEKIASAATSVSNDVVSYLVLVTGDIANWGLKQEYDVARDFFENLRQKFEERIGKEAEVRFFFVPGNHDCDFNSDKESVEVRSVLIETIPSKLGTLEGKSGIVKQCTFVQSNFFDFLESFDRRLFVPEKDRLCYLFEYEIQEKKILIQCFNTAWVSQIKESQGTLVFPVNIAKARVQETDKTADVAVSLFHHPYNWLEHSNARQFIGFLEQCSDVILTGHEHIRGGYLKSNLSGEKMTYLSGAVLQEDGASATGFNVITLNLDDSTQQVAEFVWEEEGHYRHRGKIKSHPFIRNRFHITQGFVNNEDFSNYLRDVGTEYLHPYRRKGKLDLSEVFVFPDLTERGNEKGDDRIIRSDNAIDEILSRKNVIIFGEDNSGKTSISKVLYETLSNKGFVPLLIKPDLGINGHDWDSLRPCIEKAVAEQYDSSKLEDFHQLKSERRALIIDDMHRLGLNAQSSGKLIENLTTQFEIIVVLASEFYQYHTLVDLRSSSRYFSTFSSFRIREFGRRLRGQLVRKWLLLGREMILDPKDLSFEENVLESALNATISKNVMPAYPFWILSILQMWNSDKTSNGNLGAFGYIFDSLITKQLESIGYEASNIDKIYSFLGLFAHSLFERDESTVTEQEFKEITYKYHELYKVRLEFNELANNLTEARVIRHHNGTYSFTQPYIFYFFVARYFKDNLAAGRDKETIKEQIVDMIQHISYEPYSYILLIFVYLTKDYEFIRGIIDLARQIYADIEPCDLTNSVEFLNQLNPNIEPLALDNGSVEKNRESYRSGLDETEELTQRSKGKSLSDRTVTYNDNLDDLTKIIIAMKTMELMGQILRNFPGSLLADLKSDLTRESYLLGLRTLQAFLNIAQSNIPEVRDYYRRAIQEKRENAKEREAKIEADRTILWLTSGASFSIIKRISSAVGHEDLVETYADVKRKIEPMTSVELIDLSIKLDHFRGVPHGQIASLSRTLKDNKFAHGLLRDLISHLLFLFPVDEQDRQKLVEGFNITTPQVLQLTNDSKRGRRRASRGRKSSN